MINIHNQDGVDEDTWPPDQPMYYTPLVLIQHQEHRTKEQDTEMAKLTQTGDINSVASGRLVSKHRSKLESNDTLQHVLKTSTITEEVAEILSPLEKSGSKKFILIEGVPGIGKSILLKQIAFQWAKELLLSTFKIVLLVCLRDPSIWKVSSICDLLELFCKGETKEKATKIASSCSDYLLSNGGKDITFLVDGYDELPDDLKKRSIIADILNREVLPLCGLVVSSRPHATASLRKRAAVRVNILGFTEQKRQQYIEQSLRENPQYIAELTQYLQRHPAISNYCFVPLNITILLFLYNLGIPLPKSSTSLHHHFICQTICRHLAKSGHSLKNTIADLRTLPAPYNKMIKQLAKFSLEALNNNKLVFTYEDIEAACPDIINTPEAANGFGLLHVVQHYGFSGKTMTYNFVHLSIQEYLAAHHIITDLQEDQELQLLDKQFWSDLHANVFFIYVTLTKGQRSAFKKFLSGEDDKTPISSVFLCDQIKCFRLYRCFYDAGDNRMCKFIEDAAIFNQKEIDVSGASLLLTDLECMLLFLTSSSNKQWVWLNLQLCFIQDRGLHIIHTFLKDSDVIITKLSLSDNGLTKLSSTFIRDIVFSCKVEVLWVSGNNKIGENEQFYTVLSHPYSTLTELNMRNTSLSSIGARALFTAVKNTNKLKVLYINHNAITDDLVDEITSALTTNKSLVTLVMHGNRISKEALLKILSALKDNNTLEELHVPAYPPEIKEKIGSIEQDINTNRRGHAQAMLTINCWCW